MFPTTTKQLHYLIKENSRSSQNNEMEDATFDKVAFDRFWDLIELVVSDMPHLLDSKYLRNPYAIQENDDLQSFYFVCVEKLLLNNNDAFEGFLHDFLSKKGVAYVDKCVFDRLKEVLNGDHSINMVLLQKLVFHLNLQNYMGRCDLKNGCEAFTLAFQVVSKIFGNKQGYVIWSLGNKVKKLN